MEQGGQCHGASQPEWPERLGQCGWLVVLSLTMLYQFCANPRSQREEFVKAPQLRNRSGWGLLAGVVLGAGMWAAILAVARVIKL
jgi:hypothetical protein